MTVTDTSFPTPAPSRVPIMGLGVDAVTEAETIRIALDGVAAGRGGWICPVNLDVLRQVVADPEIRALVEQADVVVADGMPLLWAAKAQGDVLPERVAGSSLVTTLPDPAAAAGASLFLLGGNPGVAEEAAQVLRARHPGIRIAGTHCPPFGFEKDPALMAAIETDLRDAQPDVVLVALGFPKQDRLITALRPTLPAAWFVSVGISLSFLTGEVSRAPRWAQRTGLEWVHRLIQEPRRLAKRYLVDGIPFVAKVLVTSARRRGARA